MKNLKTKASQIKNFSVEKITEMNNGVNVTSVLLTIKAEQVYIFRVCKDVRHPDIDEIQTNLTAQLYDYIENYKTYTIEKYQERNYLFINSIQYSGQQLQ